ncbi:uncharacterized protein LOC118183507 [Stegodyphus dumicola]|uniref:uncharacterized protein LOC118183507 n=1 Tax=Stegodyphus dumicola TaxID=202533 RepID=UPI0015A8163D|nr:uncharacterized protein LOC118183507 [Stegodyphus dumicola]
MRLNQEYVQCLQLAFGNEDPSRATALRSFTEFDRGRNFLQDEEHTGRSLSEVVSDNVSAIKKISINDNRCIYQMTQKELNIASSAIHKNIHEELHLPFPHNLTKHQKENPVRISKETLKFSKDGGHDIIYENVTDDKNHRFLTFQHIKKVKYGS